MKKRDRKQYCTLDHANKRRELARQTPYEFWLRQLEHRARAEPQTNAPRPSERRRPGTD